MCQLRVWKKTIQLKRPCMFAHTLAHTHTHLYAAPTWSILYCFVFFVICFGLGFFCVCNAAHATFFYFSHLSQNNTSPIILKYTHCCFQICWLPPVKRLVSGRGEKKIKAPQKQNMNEYIDNHKSEVLFKETTMRHSFDFVL